jgi:archaeosortase C (PEF-CTERM variant)
MDYTGKMSNPFLQMGEYMERLLPPGTSRRKVAQILSIILVVEGLSVVMLFSYAALWVGLLSLLIGVVLLTLLRSKVAEKVKESESPGIRLIDYLVKHVGGEYVVMVLGAIGVTSVLLYNQFFSPRPGLGDADTLSIMFGVVLMLYPLLHERYEVEMAFALIFIGGVVVFLVLPQVLQLFSSGSGTSAAGDWYVHYMLAAPFAGILDVIGIPASSFGDMVTIGFRDGSVRTLEISAYCAGLYSFSIFLSAFIAFILVFERLQTRLLVAILALGIVIAYLGNLFRMVVIGVVGYYYGIDALHWTHTNAGWIIFLSWSCLFWWLLLGYISKRDSAGGENHTEVN